MGNNNLNFNIDVEFYNFSDDIFNVTISEENSTGINVDDVTAEEVGKLLAEQIQEKVELSSKVLSCRIGKFIWDNGDFWEIRESCDTLNDFVSQIKNSLNTIEGRTEIIESLVSIEENSEEIVELIRRVIRYGIKTETN